MAIIGCQFGSVVDHVIAWPEKQRSRLKSDLLPFAACFPLSPRFPVSPLSLSYIGKMPKKTLALFQFMSCLCYNRNFEM